MYWRCNPIFSKGCLIGLRLIWEVSVCLSVSVHLSPSEPSSQSSPVLSSPLPMWLDSHLISESIFHNRNGGEVESMLRLNWISIQNLIRILFGNKSIALSLGIKIKRFLVPIWMTREISTFNIIKTSAVFCVFFVPQNTWNTLGFYRNKYTFYSLISQLRPTFGFAFSFGSVYENITNIWIRVLAISGDRSVIAAKL